jgi:CBS domain-containing protein
MKVRDIMIKAPVTLPIEATIHQAAVTMDHHAVGAGIVVDGGRPVGVVTDREMVVRALARREPLDARVDSVMSAGVVCVDADEELHEVRRFWGRIRSGGYRWSTGIESSGWSRSTI